MDGFEDHRDRLRGVAYRMLGSWSDADDAVQEAWLRLHRSDAAGITNPGGWLTTVVGRVCLDMLRSRSSRPEQPYGFHLPDPMVTGPEQDAETADAVGLALLVVLDTLAPDERLAFVLHDLFGVPFDEIGPIVARSPDAAKMLASRARRRVRDAGPAPDPDVRRQRRVVDAFLAAAREGDFAGLVAVLHPDVELRTDDGALRPGTLVRGAADVARGAIAYTKLAAAGRHVLINGSPGLISYDAAGRPRSLMSFTVANDRIVAMYALTDPDRLPAR